MKKLIPINTANDADAYAIKASYFKNASLSTLTGGGGHYPCTGVLEVSQEPLPQDTIRQDQGTS